MDAPQIARIINCYDFCPVSRSSDISNGSVVNAAYQFSKAAVIMTCENINIISIQNRNVAEVAFLSRVCDIDCSYTSLCEVCQVNDAQIGISIAAACILHTAQRADIQLIIIQIKCKGIFTGSYISIIISQCPSSCIYIKSYHNAVIISSIAAAFIDIEQSVQFAANYSQRLTMVNAITVRVNKTSKICRKSIFASLCIIVIHINNSDFGKVITGTKKPFTAGSHAMQVGNTRPNYRRN